MTKLPQLTIPTIMKTVMIHCIFEPLSKLPYKSVIPVKD